MRLSCFVALTRPTSISASVSFFTVFVCSFCVPHCPRRLCSHLLRCMEESRHAFRTYIHTYIHRVVHLCHMVCVWYSVTPLWIATCEVGSDVIRCFAIYWGYNFSVIFIRYLPVWACHPTGHTLTHTIQPLPSPSPTTPSFSHGWERWHSVSDPWCGVCWTLQCRVCWLRFITACLA